MRSTSENDPKNVSASIASNRRMVTRSSSGTSPALRTNTRQGSVVVWKDIVDSVGTSTGPDGCSFVSSVSDPLDPSRDGIPVPLCSSTVGESQEAKKGGSKNEGGSDENTGNREAILEELAEEDCLLKIVDVKEYVKELRELEKKVDRSNLEPGTLAATTLSKGHSRRRCKSEESFLLHLGKVYTTDKKQKWREMLVQVPNKFHAHGHDEKSDTIARIFVEISGPKQPVKKELANSALVDWHLSLKKVKNVDESKECPYLQPSSQNMMHRTLMSRLRDCYDFRYSTGDFTKFKGSLGGVLSSLYNQRLKIWGKFGYGQRSLGCRVLDHDRYRFFDLSVFDESDNEQHCRKLLIIFGSRVGFRGDKEHTFLERHQIGSGYFPPDHPLFPNVEWWGLISWGPFKNEVLGVNQSYLFEIDTHCRFPVMEKDPANDAGGPIKRWCEKIDKLDEVVSAHPKKKKNLQTRFYRRVYKGKIYPTQTLGHTRIRDMFAGSFFQMGISNWDTLHPHATRSWFITTLANSPGMNCQEVRQAARHKNASTSVEYMSRGDNSEAARLLALTRNVQVESKASFPTDSTGCQGSRILANDRGKAACGDGRSLKNMDAKVLAQEDRSNAQEKKGDEPESSSDDEGGGETLSFSIEVPPEDSSPPRKVPSSPTKQGSPCTPIMLSGRRGLGCSSNNHRLPPLEAMSSSPFYMDRTSHRINDQYLNQFQHSPDYSQLPYTLTQYPHPNDRHSERVPKPLPELGSPEREFSSHTQAEYANLERQVQELERARARNDCRRDTLLHMEERRREPSRRQLELQAMTRRVKSLVEGEGRRMRQLRQMEEQLLCASSPYRSSRQEESSMINDYITEQEELDESRRREAERNYEYSRRRRNEEIRGEEWAREERTRNMMEYRARRIRNEDNHRYGSGSSSLQPRRIMNPYIRSNNSPGGRSGSQYQGSSSTSRSRSSFHGGGGNNEQQYHRQNAGSRRDGGNEHMYHRQNFGGSSSDGNFGSGRNIRDGRGYDGRGSV